MGALQKYQLVFLCSCITSLNASWQGGRGYEECALYNAGSTLRTMDTRTGVNNGVQSGSRICCLMLGIAPLLIFCP